MNENFQVAPHLQLHVIKLKPIPLRIPCRVERFTKNLSLVGRVSKLHLRVIVYIVFLSVGILNCALDNHLSKGISGISAAVHDREASPSHHPHLHLARHLHQSLSGNGYLLPDWEHIVKHPQLQGERTCLATFSADDKVDRLTSDVEEEQPSKTNTSSEGG